MQKKIENIMAKNYTPINAKSSMNPKHKNIRKNYTNIYHNQINQNHW